MSRPPLSRFRPMLPLVRRLARSCDRVRLVVLAAAVAANACRTIPGATSPAAVARAEASARRAIAEERSRSAIQLSARAVGVAPLDADPHDTIAGILSYGLADLLSTDLARSAQLRVVERVRTDALLRELGLAASGRVDSATAPRVGLLLGARRIVVGSVATQGGLTGRLRLDLRIADVSTAGIRGSASTETPLDQLFDAEKEMAFRLFEEMGVALTPAERAAVEQRPTRNVAAFLAYSRGVRSQAFGDFRAAQTFYRQASALDPSFTQARTARTSADAVAEAHADQGIDASPLARVAGAVHETVNRPIIAPQNAPPRTADTAFPTRQLVLLLFSVTLP